MPTKSLVRGLAILLLLILIAGSTLTGKPGEGAAQQTIAAKSQAPVIPAYSDSAAGLKNLLQDWFAAIKAGDTAKGSQYLASLAIPDHQKWFTRTFGPAQGARLETKYTELRAGSLERLIVRIERTAKSEASSVETSVYRSSPCAQVAELQAVSAEMVRPTPIYRASIRSDAQNNPPDFLGNFVYVHGGFRYFDQLVMQALSIATPMRISLGEKVPAAQTCGGTTSPLYPKEAREQHIQGTVVLHVVIGTDGTIKEVQPVSGHPLLVPAAIDAVKQWRYKPTKLNGKPVEVDTQIHVIFTIQQ